MPICMSNTLTCTLDRSTSTPNMSICTSNTLTCTPNRSTCTSNT
ncbi:hypothetical protein LINGRAHAP2_LOCUS7134 [Linum grandiflorum]